MNNGKPMSKRKAARLMVALTLLAWATQTLLHQWGYGQDLPADSSVAQANASADVENMQFVSPDGSDLPVLRGTMELRTRCDAPGGTVKIKNVCRWSADQNQVFATVADLTIENMAQGQASDTITVDQIRQTLQGAGMNVAAINFCGADQCQAIRTFAFPAGYPTVLPTQNAPTPAASPVAPTAPAPAPSAANPPPPSQKLITLRDLLKQDLATRLDLPVDSLEIAFDPGDNNVLNLVSPFFQFNIYPRQARSLGDVSWGVDIKGNGQMQHAIINATARAWQMQTILRRPVDYRQVIQQQDLEQKRMLVDELSQQPLLGENQAVGMQAAQILRPGTVLTGDMVDPPLLARTGQLVTVLVTRGTVHITAVARALEPGSYGQTIRVRDESSDPPQVYDVTLTGPQTGTLSGAD